MKVVDCQPTTHPYRHELLLASGSVAGSVPERDETPDIRTILRTCLATDAAEPHLAADSDLQNGNARPGHAPRKSTQTGTWPGPITSGQAHGPVRLDD